MSVSETYILKAGAKFSLKVASKGSFRRKKLKNLALLKLIFLTKNGGLPTKTLSLINFALL